MSKTLKDCLLEGGIKWKTFRNLSGSPIKYTVEDIRLRPANEIVLYVKSDNDIGKKTKIPVHYHLNLSGCYYHILVEDHLPIPLPAP